LFQGYLLHRPDVVHRQALGTTHLSCVRLLAALHTPDSSLDDVVDLLNHDPALSVRVLKTVSSAAYAPRGGITSVRQAVVLLGRRELADWVTLLLLGGSGAGGVTQEDLVWIFTRAEACRLLSPTDPDSAFTVGLLSAAAQALGVDCAEMLRGCSLADHVRDALLHGGGELGSTLQIAAGHDTAPDLYVQAVGHARRAARKVVGGSPADHAHHAEPDATGR
jgi:EAL and modified HD-GYP domain-containing signal transduction protein